MSDYDPIEDDWSTYDTEHDFVSMAGETPDLCAGCGKEHAGAKTGAARVEYDDDGFAHIILSPEAFDALLEELDKPAVANTKLRELFQRTSPFTEATVSPEYSLASAELAGFITKHARLAEVEDAEVVEEEPKFREVQVKRMIGRRMYTDTVRVPIKKPDA